MIIHDYDTDTEPIVKEFLTAAKKPAANARRPSR